MGYTEDFHRDGFVIIPEVLGGEECAVLLGEIVESFRTSEPSVIKEPAFRRHSPLTLSPTVSDAVTAVVEHCYEPLSNLLQGDRHLVELSSITVFPNAAEQPLHRDEANAGHFLASVFINLAATSAETGALMVVPGSHDLEAGGPGGPLSIEVPQGAAVVMNSKLLHGGGANTSHDRIRPVFYFSFGESNLYGPTYSIREEVAAQRLGLDEFRPRPGLRRTGWTAECRPLMSPECRVLLPLSGHDDQLLLCRGTTVCRTLTLGEDQEWVAEMLGLIESHPQELQVGDLAGHAEVPVPTVIAMLTALGRDGWVRR